MGAMTQTVRPSALDVARSTSASGLSTPAARWTIVFAWCCVIAATAIANSFAQPSVDMVFAFAFALTGVFALTEPRDAPLRPIRAGGVVVFAVGGAALGLWANEKGDVNVWLVNFVGHLVALLIVRGNLLASVLGLLMLTLTVCGWGILAAEEITVMVNALTLPLSGFVLGLMWRRFLNRIVAKERLHYASVAESERRRAVTEAAGARFRVELDEIAAEVREPLRRLTLVSCIDDALRNEIVSVEANIRDRLRAPRLRHPELIGAVARARDRGIEVRMTSNPTENALIGNVCALRLARILDNLNPPTRVVLSTSESSADIVTVVIDSRETHQRLSVNAII